MMIVLHTSICLYIYIYIYIYISNALNDGHLKSSIFYTNFTKWDKGSGLKKDWNEGVGFSPGEEWFLKLLKLEGCFIYVFILE